MQRQKFIIVSNRLPVSVSKENGELTYTPSNGGLATAMSSLGSEQAERLWIGWPGIASDELTPADKSAITRKLRSYGCSPVFLTRRQVEKFYHGYANDTLWPLFHYFQSLANYDNEYWVGYKEVNALFKKAIVRHADPDASVWVHDYHLMLLPQLLRLALPGSTIGFFLHIPFPSYEIFRLLPNRAQILEGLLGADLIGFHMYDYARHFLSSVLRILGIESRHGSIIMDDRIIKADAFPLGIDYNRYASALRDEKTLEEIRLLDEHYSGKKIILSMDRLDYSKGIMKRLEAFDRLLQENPKLHKKIMLFVLAVPSRTEVESYQELRDEIEKAVSRINGAYGSIGWTPVSYQFKNLPFEQIVALLTKADIALLTPLRDGMNLVAKEYVATKQRRPGVLILSEMAGAVDELPEAIRINPNDIDAIVQALKTALKLPRKVQLANLKSMQSRLSRYTVQRWASDFIEQLDASKQAQAQQSSKLLTADQEARILRQFSKAKRRLLLLDYDGTLRGFVSTHNPAQAAPSQSLLKLIKDLTDIPRTKVCIISGRSRKALTGWFYGLPITLAAEHGAWMKYNGEWSQQPVSLHEHKKVILPVLEHYAERTPGARIEQKDFALVWHYRNVPIELAHARNASLHYELGQLLANTDLTIHRGAKIIEIKPRSVHKGAVAEDLMAIHKADFILCIGDDYTDEDMFRTMPEEAHSIKVGLGETSARYQVTSVQQVLKLLRKLTET
ncbi:MAG TPA: bifunctional alpha,alpha-trehalose-phosphate synthase (UDP-forming)/trehalose-phosphatase [Candidatus Limnocylindria bacterium]|nr:bifunctional alpha,alpha-trehalose-phosphate synthase (UDP-forming)/trehalose-phosphatase [Candidatus Limnocylindria bacterium]